MGIFDSCCTGCCCYLRTRYKRRAAVPGRELQMTAVGAETAEAGAGGGSGGRGGGGGGGGGVGGGGGGGKVGGDRLVRFPQPKANEAAPEGVGKRVYDAAASNSNEELLGLCREYAGSSAVLEWKNSTQGNFAPLHAAIFSGNEQAVATLLSAGADITATIREGQSPLHIAAFYGFDKIVRLLIKEGANINVYDNYMRTPLSWAREHGSAEAVAELERAGACV